MKRIILDTNFLMIPGTVKVDIFEEIKRICDFKYTLVVLQQSIDELNEIKKSGKRKDKTAATIALSLIQSHKMVVLRLGTDKYVDDIIKEIANPRTDIVATQDLGLKRALKKKGVPLIVLRKQQYCAVVGLPL